MTEGTKKVKINIRIYFPRGSSADINIHINFFIFPKIELCHIQESSYFNYIQSSLTPSNRQKIIGKKKREENYDGICLKIVQKKVLERINKV